MVGYREPDFGWELEDPQQSPSAINVSLWDIFLAWPERRKQTERHVHYDKVMLK